MKRCGDAHSMPTERTLVFLGINREYLSGDFSPLQFFLHGPTHVLESRPMRAAVVLWLQWLAAAFYTVAQHIYYSIINK